jgi:hypothetical protein
MVSLLSCLIHKLNFYLSFVLQHFVHVMLMEQELRDKMERDAEQYRAFQESVDRRFEELIASTSR